MDRPKPQAIRSIDRHLRLATATIALLIFGGGGWALTTELAGAVLASGVVVVDGNVKAVQHPVGGVVKEIAVVAGSHVRRGDIVLRLDDDVARADLALIDGALESLVIRRARLEAERDSQAAITLSPEFESRRAETDLARIIALETRYFASRSAARSGVKAQLNERVLQLREEIEGLRLQESAQVDVLALLQEELADMEQLYAEKLVVRTRILTLKREEAEMRGTLGQLRAQIASASGRGSEIELQITQIDQELRSEVTKELRETNEKIAELSQRRIGALDQLKRIDIRAPSDGFVHQLSVHTIGGVVGPGETLMLIVPGDEVLAVDIKVAAQDRDQVHAGQEALLRLSAFNQRTTPEILGEISVIGADLVEDTRTGFQYYPVKVRLSEVELERLGANRLSPGMPVESFIQTGQRTLLSYLTKPLGDYLARAFLAD